MLRLGPRILSLFGLGVVGLASAAGCDSDPADPALGPCERELSHLRECELLDADDPGDCQDSLPLRCQRECFIRASCGDLQAAQCQHAGNPPPGSLLEACARDCGFSTAFYCGDGSSVAELLVCDGTANCEDGSDERADLCTVFACGSGESLSRIYQCDGIEQCGDGSDELSCPTFACGSGEAIEEARRCDTFVDCADSSDEANCPPSIYEQLKDHCG